MLRLTSSCGGRHSFISPLKRNTQLECIHSLRKNNLTISNVADVIYYFHLACDLHWRHVHPTLRQMLQSRELCYLLDWWRPFKHQLATQIIRQKLQKHTYKVSWSICPLLFAAEKRPHHLLIVEVHIEVTVERQRTVPHYSPQGQEDGTVIWQDVQQILLSLEGMYHPIWPEEKQNL